ncbi:hypothetical protein [Marinitoga sp. 38H-ov]|uniref:hypothetical protein n=1 Tax=Marinitoga sp. 38H-ov TaxID=1755814 RepID=UPI0013EB0352|nr:hypothetical protein [Marinitoga sp. 38H-ov]KAF2955057.1 hypothetical protein AS160_02530 [Marinitoga sp. 38H-ov]
MFSNIFYSLYSFVDVETPPSTTSKRLEISIEGTRIIIDFENQKYIDNINNYNVLIKSIFKDYFQRKIFVIANDCLIKDNDSYVLSTFVNWDKNLEFIVKKNNSIFKFKKELPIGENVIKVPNKWIKVKFIGYTGEATLNGQKIIINSEMEFPNEEFKLETPYENVYFNLSNINYPYEIKLLSEIILKEIKFEKIINIFELESGIEILGKNKSVWISKDKEEILSYDNAIFVSPYGLLEKNKNIQFNGIPVFAYEKNKTIYLISSYGEVISLGTRNIYRDLERSPASINVENEFIKITTFGGKKYIIDLKNGGLFYDGETAIIKNNIKLFVEKEFILNNKNIFIHNNNIKITQKK